MSTVVSYNQNVIKQDVRMRKCSLKIRFKVKNFFLKTIICRMPTVMDMFIKKDLTKLVCSHRLAYVYFTNAIAEKISGGCSFPSYYWDGSYDDADRILKQRTIGSYCYDCPEMGLDAKNTTRTGMFMVITSDSEPYCREFY